MEGALPATTIIPKPQSGSTSAANSMALNWLWVH